MKKSLVIMHTGLAGALPHINRKKFDHVVDLHLEGDEQNVEIRFQNIEEKIIAKLGPEAKDLLEVAAALYVADTSIGRGQTDVYGRDWQRSIHFILPVRRVRKWRKVASQLSELVTYLSGDASITFDFRRHKQNEKGQRYFEFPASARGFQGADRIVLFSGGLDSFAGAVSVLSSGKVPLLISHRSSPTRTQLQESLPERLRQKTGKRLPLIYAWITRKGAEAIDNTQRLRSFLYMSLAAIVANELKIEKIFYCENGMTTFNLPLSEQRVGSRSTRTTHPRVISLFSSFIEQLLRTKLVFDNPFLLKTKTEVIARLVELGYESLIAQTLSCTRTFAVEKTKRHCGVCIQCLTRRFAVVAADVESHDPVDDYVKDIFRDRLAKGEERGNAIDWLNFNLQVSDFSLEGLFQRFAQLHEALRFIRGDSQSNSRAIYDMYQRNAEQVQKAVKCKHNQYYGDFLSGKLPADSFIGLIGSRVHLRPQIVDFLEEIESKLLPRLREAFAQQQPNDEAELHRDSGIILRAAGYKIEPESPQFSFSIVKTRPDYSFPESGVFLELKLFKESGQRSQIVDGILADIQKYRKKCQGMLFVVYQTRPFITDAVEFATSLTDDSMVRIAVLG
jgi:7-cyano-7-deazaguanine synthase in queuosine biosynthesis